MIEGASKMSEKYYRKEDVEKWIRDHQGFDIYDMALRDVDLPKTHTLIPRKEIEGMKREAVFIPYSKRTQKHIYMDYQLCK